MSETFSTRWGLILATLGMAVGTGNIWRFPRIVATNGGGSFLVAWVVFLLMWSVPLMIVEFSFGKKARLGTVGAFRLFAGEKAGWMGGWAALCAAAIGFYYSVVAGWCLRYFFASLVGELGRTDSQAFWEAYAGTGQSFLTHALALGLAVLVVWFGVRGIERVAKVLIPTLVVLVLVLAIRAVTLPGAMAGLEFLFRPDWSALGDVNIWLQALTQNAWDTGAGWGLILTYATYMRLKEDVPLNAFLIGFGNNSMSLLAGIMVLCTVFAINPGARDQIVGAGNEGLTFIWMPQLFNQMPAGGFFMCLFFLALSFAALTSLISMLELITRIFIDAGFTRKKALLAVGLATLWFGAPSAFSLDFLHNQDWVWGVGLMVSGLFFALAARKYGVEKIRSEIVNAEGCDLRIGRWWNFVISVVVPIEAVVLTVWWLWEARGWDPEGWLDPFGSATVGTVLVQFAIALVGLILLDRWLVARRLESRES
ncbi:MAG: sodium-dependent transporter [Thermoanaerobaculia bacterium]